MKGTHRPGCVASGVAGEMSQGALRAPSLFLGKSLYTSLGVCKGTEDC